MEGLKWEAILREAIKTKTAAAQGEASAEK